jgi:hypothetical protein
MLAPPIWALKFIEDHFPNLKPKSRQRYRISIEVLPSTGFQKSLWAKVRG